MQLHPGGGWSAFILVFALLVGSGAAWAGPLQVDNKAPAESPRRIVLEERWRVGGEAGETEGLFFGAVTEAAADAAGNVYLLDTQQMHLIKVSPRGTVLDTLGREGEGPGEVQRPRDVVCLPDATVALLDMFPAKLVKLSLEGEPRGDIRLGINRDPAAGGFTAASQCVYRGGTLLLTGQHTGRTETGQRRVLYLSRLDLSGEEQLRFCETQMELDFGNLCFIERELSPHCHQASAVGPDGRVYFPQDWDRYAIEVRSPDGSLDRIITRSFENRPRTEDELRRVNAVFDASAANTPYKMTRRIEANPAVIEGLHVDHEGQLWVLHSRSAEDLPDGVVQAYDVFSPDGHYLYVAHLACEGRADQDGFEFLPDGRVLLIKGQTLSAMARTDLGSVPLGEEEEIPPIEIVCLRRR